MRAMAIEEYGGPEKLRQMSFPRPVPEQGEVLLHVVAAGVNPIDCAFRAGRMVDRLDCRLPMIPGWDVAGSIEELGPDSSRFRKGDRVWAFAGKPTVQWGCYAEYVAVPESNVARMPAKLLFEEAAAVPVAALTAYQALFGRTGVQSGSSVLIHAAAGGVGHFAVQMARNAGARVIGTASGGKQGFILALGAEFGIDYTRDEFPETVLKHFPQGVDFILDAVGGDTLARSYPLLKAGGRLVSTVQEPDARLAEEREAQASMVLVEPDGEMLGNLAQLFDLKKLKTQVQKIYPLSGAAEAHRVLEDGHVQGKLVLNL